jgi:hypothetical protein
LLEGIRDGINKLLEEQKSEEVANIDKSSEEVSY